MSEGFEKILAEIIQRMAGSQKQLATELPAAVTELAKAMHRIADALEKKADDTPRE